MEQRIGEFTQVPYEMLDRASQLEKVQFIKRTYKYVAGSVIAFAVLEAMLLSIPGIGSIAQLMTGGYAWLLVLGGFMFATTYAEKMAMGSHDSNKQHLGLGIYIVAEALIFIPIMYVAMAMTGGQVIYQAGLVTFALFTGLTAVVLTTGKDFSFLKAGLTIGFVIAMGLIVAGILFGFDLGLWFSGAMVLLAAGSILYQTSNMIHKYSTDQHVAAALGLFASFMLLFWYILQIFLSRD